MGSNIELQTEHQDVLHRLLAEIMVDPEYLLLVERLQHRSVERARRGEIAPEWLFDDDARPSLVRVREAATAKLTDDV